MSKVKQFQLIILAVIVLFVMFPFIGQTSIKGTDTNKDIEKRSDRIEIQLKTESGKDEMPAVDFKHDLHTKAVEGKCSACHETKDDAFVFKFKRTDEKASMDLYHAECISCHSEKKASSVATGPDAAECRLCHVAGGVEKASSWVKINFDKSLHYTHAGSKQIKGVDMQNEENCSACHHQYNEKTKEIFYTKGEEASCSYCHKPVEKDEIRTIRDASHDSCVTCHETLKGKEIAAGPTTCDACHEVGNQQKIKQIPMADIPRLKRGQPDTVAMTAWTTPGILKDGEAKDGKVKSNYMDAVAFDHQSHEVNTQSCTACHHETLKKCADCHGTEGGQIKGGFISLEQAMHKQDSTRSCVGCHAEATKSSDCAGCHVQIPAAAKTSESCKSCHNLNRETLSTGDPAGIAKVAMLERSSAYTAVALNKIPEVVVIDSLANEYKPSSFPHGKVVRAISERVAKNTMAKAFHRDQERLCVGCHHNSPKSLNPPECASCHSKNGPVTDASSDGRPGLKGAYHGQCITCHQEMKVTSVAATDCAKCHEEKK
jgi:hypothetical protein